MKKIMLLIDYKNHFGSKYNAQLYRSGIDKNLLKKYFKNNGYEVITRKFSNVNFKKDELLDIPILYESIEDYQMFYKTYIEDIILGLEVQGRYIIPKYSYLRAHDNKVFMEILRKISNLPELKTIETHHFGTYEEFYADKQCFSEDKYVIKSSQGAMSSGVELSNSKADLLMKIKALSSTKDLKYAIKDKLRTFKHKGYINESIYRKKYIVQNFIPNLKNDWKIIIFGERYYIFYRATRDNDFRASGSKKFIFNDETPIPNGIFDFAKKVFDSFDAPNLSLDIVFDGNKFHVIEFQFVYFGTIGHSKSKSYFKFTDNEWKRVYERLDLEEIYVDSIIKFLEKR